MSTPLCSKKRLSSTATIACFMIGAIWSEPNEDTALVAAEDGEDAPLIVLVRRRVDDRVDVAAPARRVEGDELGAEPPSPGRS